jgi:quercetin dioxygenase-like cupin family protein
MENPLMTPNPSDETIRIGPLVIHFLITGADSGGSVAAFELTVPGSQRLAAPSHSHDAYEETIYQLQGSLTWTVNGEVHTLSPGQCICIPRGAVHRFDNNTNQDSKSLCVISPAALGPEYFRETAEVFKAASPTNPPDRNKLLEIMRRHGLTPAP